jgi:transposase
MRDTGLMLRVENDGGRQVKGLREIVLIHDLKRQGLSITAIARKVGCDRKTVRKYLELGLGAISFDAVKHLVLCQVERRPTKLYLDIYLCLPRATVAATSTASYMSLLLGHAARPWLRSSCSRII